MSRSYGLLLFALAACKLPDIDTPGKFIDNDGDEQTEAEGDCNDADAAIYLGATEVCDGYDNDCDGRPDDTFDDVCLAPQNPFTCSNANPPPTVLPFSLFRVDPDTGGPIFPAGNPPAATGGNIQNGRYEPTQMEVYGQAAVPTFGVNELTFELRDGFALGRTRYVDYIVGGPHAKLSDQLIRNGLKLNEGQTLPGLRIVLVSPSAPTPDLVKAAKAQRVRLEHRPLR